MSVGRLVALAAALGVSAAALLEDAGAGAAAPAAPDPVHALLAEPDGVALARAFARLADPAARRAFVRAIAAAADAAAARAA